MTKAPSTKRPRNKSGEYKHMPDQIKGDAIERLGKAPDQLVSPTDMPKNIKSHTAEIRMAIMNHPSGDMLQQMFECWRTGYKQLEDPVTGLRTSLKLSEKAITTIGGMVLDRLHPKLTSVSVEDSGSDQVPMPTAINIIVRDASR